MICKIFFCSEFPVIPKKRWRDEEEEKRRLISVLLFKQTQFIVILHSIIQPLWRQLVQCNLAELVFIIKPHVNLLRRSIKSEGISSIAVQRVWFDFGLKKSFKKKLAFPPLYRNFHRLLLATFKECYMFFK